MPKLNVVPKPTDKVDDFLTQAARAGRTGVPCWREILPDDAREALVAMEERMAHGEHFSWEATSNALKDLFGLEIAANTIARHYKKRCRCG